MGLTGVIEEASLQARPIASSRLSVLDERTGNLDESIARLIDLDRTAEYTMAWVDLAAKRVSAGRSVITSGRFARADELLKRWASQPFAYDPGIPVDVPITPRRSSSTRCRSGRSTRPGIQGPHAAPRRSST
ncbi:MAG: hypothetical protein WA988_20190 [Candidatus Nanopelagicales bacterium]